MNSSTKCGDLNVGFGSKLMPCVFKGETPQFMGLANATGFVLRSSSFTSDYYFTDLVATKKNKQMAKAKAKEEKAAKKAAAKEEKAAKKAAAAKKKANKGLSDSDSDEEPAPKPKKADVRIGQGGKLAKKSLESAKAASEGAGSAGAAAAQSAKTKKDATIQQWIEALMEAGWCARLARPVLLTPAPNCNRLDSLGYVRLVLL
jgi:hypothetical protein